jgi:hypothetical protein
MRRKVHGSRRDTGKPTQSTTPDHSCPGNDAACNTDVESNDLGGVENAQGLKWSGTEVVDRETG